MQHIPEEFARGQRDSQTDIVAGCPKLFWQTRGSWGDLLTRMMSERFGVVVEHTSDITYAAEVSYRRGYNEATAAHIEETFGEGSYQTVMDEVNEYRLESYRRYEELKKQN
jgi:hypothetical protein